MARDGFPKGGWSGVRSPLTSADLTNDQKSDSCCAVTTELYSYMDPLCTETIATEAFLSALYLHNAEMRRYHAVQC